MDVYDVLVQQINEKVQQLSDHVVRGNLETFDEYKRICGEVRGLLIAKDYTLDLKQRLEHSDE